MDCPSRALSTLTQKQPSRSRTSYNRDWLVALFYRGMDARVRRVIAYFYVLLVPYEFTVRRTEKPPTELIDKFRRMVEDASLQGILGLYHVDGEKAAPAIIEWTEGRKKK
ncbi:hypothetical protein F5Y07DRAFT_403274 [Xylaria sp. FL0933]|nr:hypothetical protein F5Y07DRAFT_403274 [Xylaria sp. FL0933]